MAHSFGWRRYPQAGGDPQGSAGSARRRQSGFAAIATEAVGRGDGGGRDVLGTYERHPGDVPGVRGRHVGRSRTGRARTCIRPAGAAG
ncbi:hypothetical protein J7E95_26960 [Streptomyces sp. ISL-14]|nr:hypothetical protein [Streptomyces sp. ISL-14]